MKKSFTRLIAVIIGFATILPLEAQTIDINLDKAIEMALDKNQDIKIARMNVNQAEAAVNEAYGYALPTVELSANLSHFIEKPKMPFPDLFGMLNNSSWSILHEADLISEQQMNDNLVPVKEELSDAFFQSDTYEAKLQVTQILFNSAVFKGIGVAGKYLETSEEALKAKTIQTVFDVKKAYNAVLLTQQVVVITNASFENAKDNLSNVKALHKEGLVSDYDAFQAEVQVENIRPMLVNAQNNLNMAMNGLKVLLGISPETEVNINGELKFQKQNLETHESLVAKSKKQNLDLNTLKLKREVDEGFIEADRAEYWPSVALFGSYSRNGTGNDFDFTSYSQSMVGVQFSMNLFNGMRTENKVQQKTIEVMKTDEQIAMYENALTMQVKNKRDEIESILSNIEAQERNVKLAEKTYDLAKVRYKEGTGNQLEIQNSDLALRTARLNLLTSIFDYTVNTAELDKLIGKIDQKYLTQTQKNRK